MGTEKLSNDIYTYIKKEMNNSSDFDISTNIVEVGLLDSMAIMTLVSFLEGKYGVEIDFENITPENFATVDAIANFIKKLLGRANDRLCSDCGFPE